MSTPLSPTIKAGNLLRLLGWILLGFSISTDFAIALILLLQRVPLQPYVLVSFAAAILVSLAVLQIGTGVRRNRRWAKVAGFAAAIFGLIVIPVGTMIGVHVMMYLIKGWSDSA